MQRIRLILWAIVGIVAAGMGLFLWQQQRQASPQDQVVDYRSAIGGPFTLVDGKGQPFSSQKLAGRPHAIFFGFTHCPDVCPTTLARLANLRQAQGGEFDIVFITVDPARDGPAEVGAYGELFGAPVIGLTGSQAQIDAVKKQFGVFSEEVPDGDGGYSVDHTATVFLIDRNGQFQATLSPEESRDASLAKLKRLVG